MDNDQTLHRGCRTDTQEGEEEGGQGMNNEDIVPQECEQQLWGVVLVSQIPGLSSQLLQWLQLQMALKTHAAG